MIETNYSNIKIWFTREFSIILASSLIEGQTLVKYNVFFLDRDISILRKFLQYLI